jgi:cbb3-type cytochrome oxidase subunit 3
MFKHYFERIADQISIYPIISLLVFFMFFLGLLGWTYWAKKPHMDYMANLPLNDQD